jgi:hypothetical protein
MGFPYALGGGGYSTGGLAQAMRNGGPKLCKEISPNRTKVFHVKRFGTIDGLRERTFAKRGQIRNGDLAQAENRCRFKLWPERFFELFQNPRPHPEEQAKPAPQDGPRCALALRDSPSGFLRVRV